MSLSFSLGKCWKFSEHFKKHFPTGQREKRGNDCIVHGFNFRRRANGQRVIPSGQDSSIFIIVIIGGYATLATVKPKEKILQKFVKDKVSTMTAQSL